MAVVNESLARYYFGADSAIGERIDLSGEPQILREIVSVVRDAKLAHKALHRLIVTREAVVRHQVLPDGFAITSSCQTLFDQLAVLFTDTCRWRRNTLFL